MRMGTWWPTASSGRVYRPPAASPECCAPQQPCFPAIMAFPHVNLMFQVLELFALLLYTMSCCHVSRHTVNWQ